MMCLRKKMVVVPVCTLSFFATIGIAHAASGPSEEQLQEVLTGYIAGKPVNCIPQYAIQSVRIFDGTALLYKMNGDKYYLNLPDSGASSLDDNDVLVTENYTSQLCAVDVVKLWDPVGRMETGFVGLGKFIPYTKATNYE